MLLCLLALGLASPVLQSPPAPQAGQAGQEEAQEAPESKGRTTVLHLANGQILRVRAREVEGRWEVLSHGAWTALPEGLVERAKDERELLAQAAKLQRSLPRDDLVRRVAFADWLVGEGLHLEALKQLDRVLETDPDQADALALLARADIPLALPHVPSGTASPGPSQELVDYLGACARLDGAAREIAIQRLASAPEIAGLRATLSAWLLDRSTARRELATVALQRMFPGSEPEGLISRAVLDSSREVRTSAARALKAFDNASVIEPALRALGSKHAEVRTNAIEALGTMEYREAVEPLFDHLVALQSGGGSTGSPRVYIFTGRQRAYVQDFDVEVAQFEAIADPIINVLTEGQVLDVAVVGVTEYVVASERASTRRALAKLTGANPGETTTAWQRWWNEHGDEWRVREATPGAPTSPGQG